MTVSDLPPVSSSIPPNRKRSTWRATATFLLLAAMLVSTAIGASGIAANSFECRRAARLVYKVEAEQCQELEASPARSCIRQARRLYRAHKVTCGDK